MRIAWFGCLFFSITAQSAADVLRVDDDAAPGGDGSSWGRAFDSLSDALSFANAGDEIWVAGGEYFPDFATGGALATFNIPSGVRVYGGFQGNETSLAQRGNPLSPLSVLNGARQSHHVVTMDIVDNTTILDGFRVMHGSARAGGSFASGGGIYAFNSTPIIRNIHFYQNSSITRGGGFHLEGSQSGFTEITDCLFEENNANHGSALYATCPIIMSGCTVRDNVGDSSVALLGSGTHTVDDCVVEDNFGDFYGGFLVSMEAGLSSSLISNTIFRDNTADLNGALGYTNHGAHEVRSCEFYNNHGESYAGALHIQMLAGAGNTVTVENSIMSGNTSTDASGAITLNSNNEVVVTNSTVYGNTSASSVGGGILVTTGTMRVQNSILWANTANGASTRHTNLWYNGLSNTTAHWSLIQYSGPTPVAGANNIDDNPQFVDPDGNDNVLGTTDDNFRLSPGSPAIDAASNLYVGPFVISDIYGSPRFADDTGTPDTGDTGGLPPVVDIGASEFQGTTPSDCLADVNQDGMLTPADFSAWIAAFNAMLPTCDQNADGSCTPADFTAWIANYNAGC